jgi:hypothetical protein
MKPDELRKLIRGVIQEELKNQLPALIPQILTEILNGKIAPKPLATTYKPAASPKPQPPKEVKKEFKKYTNNPLLNQILNETTNKLVSENSFTGFGERPAMSSVPFNIEEHRQDTTEKVDYSMLNESSAPSTPVVTNIVPATEEQAKVLGKINRDFRGLMKAINQKRSSGLGASTGGPISFDG